MEENENNSNNVGKKVLKIILMAVLKLLPYILIMSIILSVVAAIIKFVVVHNGSYAPETKENVPSTVESMIREKLGENLKIKKDANGYSYDVDIEQFVDELIEKLHDNNSVLKTYIDKEDEKEYLSNFIKAELVTQNFKIGNADPLQQDEFNGVIKVNRRTTDNTTVNLEYIDYDTFQQYVEAGNRDVFNYYTVDGRGMLVIAQYVEVTTEITSDVPGISSSSDKSFTISQVSVDYKAMLDSYAMPFNFLWALLVKCTEGEFVNEVAKLALDSEITITAFDNLSTTVETEVTSYKVEITTTELNQETGEEETTTTTETRHVTKVVTTNTDTVSVNVTYADVWMAKYSIEYTQEVSELAPSSDEETVQKENATKQKVSSNTSITEKDSTYSMSTSSKIYKEGTPVVEEKTDPNATEKNFVTLLKEYKRAEEKIMDAPTWLFEMMKTSGKTSDMIDLVKYLLYKATGEDLGVTELNESWLKPSTFTEINSSGSQQLIEYIHMLEGGYSPKMNADGTKYIVVSDGYGNAAVGWGVDIFNSGYADKFIQAGYSTEVGAEIDKDFVDAIEAEIISNIAQEVNNRTSGLNLKGYQKNALISRAYNCGVNGALGLRNGLTFVEAYQKYWNEATDDYYERQSNVANYSHDLYTEYMIDPRTSNGIYSDGLAKRRKSEWTLFQTGYYDVLNQRHSEGSATIIEAAHKIHKHMEDYKYTYSLTTLPGTANIAWNMRTSCCATYVDWVLAEAGYKKADESLIHGACTLFRVYQEKGFMVIENYSDLQPGDIVFMTAKDNSTITYNGRTLLVGHVPIYAGDGMWYNAGSTERIQQKSPYKSNPSSAFAIALRAN